MEDESNVKFVSETMLRYLQNMNECPGLRYKSEDMGTSNRVLPVGALNGYVLTHASVMG